MHPLLLKMHQALALSWTLCTCAMPPPHGCHCSCALLDHPMLLCVSEVPQAAGMAAISGLPPECLLHADPSPMDFVS